MVPVHLLPVHRLLVHHPPPQFQTLSLLRELLGVLLHRRCLHRKCLHRICLHLLLQRLHLSLSQKVQFIRSVSKTIKGYYDGAYPNWSKTPNHVKITWFKMF
ncbi:unnamed protein product, partial [Brassica rapa subsp. narinosa]